MIDARKKTTKAWISINATFTAPLAKFLAAHIAISAPGSGFFAKRWMTAGLLVVNLALVAVVVGPRPRAQAQVHPGCQVCHQGLERSTLQPHHAIHPFDGYWGSRPWGAYSTNHRAGWLYKGGCAQAHYRVVCCVPY